MALRLPQVTHLLHAQLAGPNIEWRGGFCACQRNIVLTGQVHFPDDLRFQLPIPQAAVAKALSLPFLCSITVFAYSKPVSCASERCQHTSTQEDYVCLDNAIEKTKPLVVTSSQPQSECRQNSSPRASHSLSSASFSNLIYAGQKCSTINSIIFSLETKEKQQEIQCV